MCAFVVLRFVFPYQTKRLAWGTSQKWPILCPMGRKTTTIVDHKSTTQLIDLK